MGTLKKTTDRLKGSVLVTAVLFIPVLLSFAVGSVDLGYVNAEKARIQTVADMALVSALGNVDWQNLDVDGEKAEIQSNINAFITANNYDPANFSAPVFEDDGENVTSVSINDTVPVKTFFWNIITPGKDTLDVSISSSAEVEYSSQSQTLAPDFGLYALNDLVLKSAQIQIGSYNSLDDEFQEYYDIVIGAGNNLEVSNSDFFGDIYAGGAVTSKGGKSTVYGDITVGDLANSDLPTSYEREYEDGYDDNDIINASTEDGIVNETQTGKVNIEVPTAEEVELMDNYVSWEDLIARPENAGVVKTNSDGTYTINNKTELILHSSEAYLIPEGLDIKQSQGSFLIADDDPDSTEDFATIYTENSFMATGRFSIQSEDDTSTNAPGNSGNKGGGNNTTPAMPDAPAALRIVDINMDDDPTERDFFFTGQSEVYLDIIAPNSTVKNTGNSGMKGRIYAYNIWVKEEFYYDKNLSSLGFTWSGPPEVSIKAHLVK